MRWCALLVAGVSTATTLTLPDVSRAEALRTLALPLGGVAAFRGGAALAVVGQPRAPALPSPVGCRVARVPASDGSGSCRVKIFYPAAAPAPEDAPYCLDGRATSDGMAGLVGFRQLGLAFLLAHLADAPSGCGLDAAPVATKLPLLVYSHGFGGNADMASYFLSEVAAAGSVVAAVEHTDGTASNTVLEDGTALPFAPGRLSRREQLDRRAGELVDVAKALRGADGLPPLGETFLGGHSYGGPSALLAASRFACAGLVLHDPALGMGYASEAAARTVSFTSDEYDAAGVRCGATFHCRGAFHGNFVDAPLWAPPWVMRPLSSVIPAAGPVDPSQAHAALAAAAATFMRGEDVAPDGFFERRA